MTETVKNFVERNAEYVKSFTDGHLALPPARKYTVVTCMDARIDPKSAFGITLGDAHVIRNAGGSAKEGLRSLVISQQLLGTQEVLIVKHTGCGMLTFQNEDARAVVEKNLGTEARKEVEDLDFLPFPELEQSVKDDIAWLRGKKVIPDSVEISGWIYEVETGKVRPVK